MDMLILIWLIFSMKNTDSLSMTSIN